MRCREVKWKHQITCWHRSGPDWDPARQSCTFNSHSWIRPCPYSNREMVACPAQSDSRDASDLCSSCQICPQRQLETHRAPLILLCLWIHAAVPLPQTLELLTHSKQACPVALTAMLTISYHSEQLCQLLFRLSIKHLSNFFSIRRL